MTKPRFYMLALLAIHPDPAHTPPLEHNADRGHYLSTPAGLPLMSLWAGGLVAPSEADARERGMQLNLETSPPEGGWINHCVAASPVFADSIEQIARDCT